MTVTDSAPIEKTKAPNETAVTEPKDKPTVQEQIKKQTEEKEDTLSRPNGLTKIEKGGNGKKTGSKGNGKLTPIEDKFKKDNPENPLTPTNPKKDNITDNPLNNQ